MLNWSVCISILFDNNWQLSDRRFNNYPLLRPASDSLNNVQFEIILLSWLASVWAVPAVHSARTISQRMRPTSSLNSFTVVRTSWSVSFLISWIGGDNPLDKAKLPPIKRVLALDPGEDISVIPLSPKKLPKLDREQPIEEMEGEPLTADDDTSLEDLTRSVKEILAN